MNWDQLINEVEDPTKAKKTDWDALFGKTPEIKPQEKPTDLPSAPQWADVIEPAKQRAETAEGVGEFITAGVAKFDKALAGMFNQLDYVQTSLGDAINTILVGKETANEVKKLRNKYGVSIGDQSSINSIRPFNAIAKAIDWAASGAKELPNTVLGDVVGGIGSIGPEIIAAAVAPEIKTARFLSDMGIKFASKFGTVMAAEGFVGGMQAAEGEGAVKSLTTPFISGVEQYMTGWMYDNMGAISSELGGRLASKLIPEVKTVARAKSQALIHSLGTTVSNALMFGGYGTAVEFLEKGESSWKTLGTGIGMGIGMGTREVGKSIWSKGINSFIASDKETIKRIAESDVSSEELITHAQEKTKAVENKTSKNPEGDVTSALLSNNAAILKGFIEEMKANPEKVVQSIEESQIPQELKTHLIDKIQQVSADIDPLTAAAKPYTDKIADLDKQIDLIKTNPNYSPELKEIKMGSMAEKRGVLASKVLEAAKEIKKVSDEKKTEDLKQARIAEDKAARVFPQFNEQLTAVADEFGATVETRLKAPESTTRKTAERNVEVKDIGDIIGGRIIVKSFKDFAPLTKRLKEVYPDAKISNKRNLTKEGDIGVRVKLNIDGIGTEIQIETDKTAEARKQVENIRDKYRKEGIPEPINVENIEKKFNEVSENKFTDPKETPLKNTQYAILTAENPGGKEISPEENTTRNEALIKELKDAGYKPIPVEGQYGGNPEHSFLVPGMTDVEALEFGKRHGQESVLTPKGLVYQDATVNPADVSKINFAGDQTDYFSKIKIGDKEVKFSIPINFDTKIPLEKDARLQYEESLAESRNILSEAYKGMEEVNLVGSPAITAQKKKMKELGIPIAQQRELNKAWTVTKNKLLGELKDKTAETKAAFNEFVDNLFGKKNKIERDLSNIKKYAKQFNTFEDFKNSLVYQGGKKGTQSRSFAIDPNSAAMFTYPKSEGEGELRLLMKDKVGEEQFILENGTQAWEVLSNSKDFLATIPVNLKESTFGVEEKLRDIYNKRNEELTQFNLPGLNIHLRSAMLKKVNSIDPAKPSTLNKAIEYFDKIVNNATWRYNYAKAEQALDILDKKSSEESLTKKAPNQPPKNIKGPSGLPLWDEIKSIRDDMVNKDWQRGQEAIENMVEIYAKEGRELGADEFNHITRLNFWGALNSTNKGEHDYLTGAARDLMDIRRTGTSKSAAARMVKQAQETETLKESVAAIKGKKALEEDTRNVQNKKNSFLKEFGATVFDWPMSSSLFSHIEFLSQHDRTSKPYEGILHKSLGDPMWYANRQLYIDRTSLFNEIIGKSEEIFGKKELRKNSKDRTSTIHTVKYKDVAGTDKELNLTTNQAIKVYMELQDPSLEKSHEAGYYKRNGELTELGKGVIDLLTPEAKAWGDWQLNEFYPKLYEILNPVYRQFYGRDMPRNDVYSPIFIEGADKKAVSDDDLLSRQSFVSELKNGSLLSRVKHGRALRLMDADQTLTSHVLNMTYWKNYTEPIQILNSFVNNSEVRNTIKQVFSHGDQHLRILQKDVTDLLQRPTDAWMTAGTIRKVRNNILLASLALKIPVGMKQLSAIPAYMEFIPMKEIPKYAIENLVHWFGDKGNLALGKKLWNDAYMQQRYSQGWDNVITEIMATDYHSVGNKSNWRSRLMFPILGGDAVSVFTGGIPVYRYAYDQAMKAYGPGSEKLAEATALHAFSRATDDTQQSGLHFNLSQVQTANDFFKTMTMYKSAPMQYHRKVSAAVRNLATGRGTWEQNIKTIAVYHVIMPALFQFMANGFKWDTKDEIRAGAIGNLNNLFALGDAVEGIINVAQGESWKKYNVSPILTTYDDAVNVVKHLPKVYTSKKKMIEGIPEEYVPQVLEAAKNYQWNTPELLKTLKYASKVLGAGFGLPIPGATAMGQGIYDVATGNEEGKPLTHKIQRVLGSSNYTLGDAVDDSDLTDEEVEKLLKTETKPVEEKTPEPVKNKNKGNIPNF